MPTAPRETRHSCIEAKMDGVDVEAADAASGIALLMSSAFLFFTALNFSPGLSWTLTDSPSHPHAAT